MEVVPPTPEPLPKGVPLVQYLGYLLTHIDTFHDLLYFHSQHIFYLPNAYYQDNE